MDAAGRLVVQRMETQKRKVEVEEEEDEKNEEEEEEEEDKHNLKKVKEVTSSSEDEDEGQEIVIRQYPGYWGSTAGDCAVIITPHSKWIIDLGHSKLNDTLKTKWFRQMVRPDTKVPLSILITHFHTDHTGAGKVFKTFGNMGATFYHGEVSNTEEGPAATLYGKLASSVKQHKVVSLQADLGAKRGTLHTLLTEVGKRYTLTIEVLIPETPKDSIEENDYSLGALITIVMSPDEGSPVPFSFLTMGDITPKAADAALKLALGKLKGGKVSLLKYPHHGSFSNYHEAYGMMCDPGETRVLFSGSTGKDVSKTIGLLKAKKILSLVDASTQLSYKEELKHQVNFDKGSVLVDTPLKATLSPSTGSINYKGEW